MKSFSYTITDPEGFHARPAGLFVKKCKEFTSSIEVVKDGKRADARKMFGLMGLGIKGGNTIEIRAEGADEAEAVQALEEFLKANL